MEFRFKLRQLGLVVLALSFLACGRGALKYEGENSSSSLPTTGLQVLSQNCTGCHGQGSVGEGGLNDILNPAFLISEGYVIAGSPDTSPLMIRIAEGSMPPTGPLSADAQAIIRQWILDGANETPTDPNPTPTPAPTPTPIPLAPTYQSLYQNIFAPKCLSCHSGANPPLGLNYSTYAGTLAVVNVNNPAQSRLYRAVNRGEMPPPPNAPLGNAEVSAILQWIQDGAPNN